MLLAKRTFSHGHHLAHPHWSIASDSLSLNTLRLQAQAGEGTKPSDLTFWLPVLMFRETMLMGKTRANAIEKYLTVTIKKRGLYEERSVGSRFRVISLAWRHVTIQGIKSRVFFQTVVLQVLRDIGCL